MDYYGSIMGVRNYDISMGGIIMVENEECLWWIMMFVFGNNLVMVKDVGIYGVDLIMFDLEDVVLMVEKDVVWVLVYEVLKM